MFALDVSGYPARMPSREEVRQAVLRTGSYERAGSELGIAPGLAFLIDTGVPADSSSAVLPDDPSQLVPAGSTQELVNPPAHNPMRSETVLAWVRERAARDLARGG
jgi:hypothetical protein